VIFAFQPQGGLPDVQQFRRVLSENMDAEQ
jgi:hypothetical protein